MEERFQATIHGIVTRYALSGGIKIVSGTQWDGTYLSASEGSGFYGSRDWLAVDDQRIAERDERGLHLARVH